MVGQAVLWRMFAPTVAGGSAGEKHGSPGACDPNDATKAGRKKLEAIGAQNIRQIKRGSTFFTSGNLRDAEAHRMFRFQSCSSPDKVADVVSQCSDARAHTAVVRWSSCTNPRCYAENGGSRGLRIMGVNSKHARVPRLKSQRDTCAFALDGVHSTASCSPNISDASSGFIFYGFSTVTRRTELSWSIRFDSTRFADRRRAELSGRRG